MFKEYIIQVDRYIIGNFPAEVREISILGYKVLALLVLLFGLAFLLKKLLLPIIKWTVKKLDRPLYSAFYEKRVFRSFLNFVPILFCYFITEEIFYRSKRYLPYVDKIFNWIILSVCAQILYRTTKAMERYTEQQVSNYGTSSVKAVGQSVRMLGFFLYIIISLSIFLSVSPGSILAGLGAVTALILLVFRDSILGFISGITVATSRLFKVGDWINMTKYNLEGTVLEINLLTTKIKNFDNTISSVPTYDLISSEVRNAQVLIDKNSRRIKRSIYFNIKSFQFIDYEKYERLSRIDLLKEYFLDMKKEVKRLEKVNDGLADDYLINGKQLTNIGTFRKYVLEYLRRHEKIDEQQALMVRQLEITPQGMPLEIYCFTTTGLWGDFENLQSDIFDHILVAAREFDLEIMQLTVNSIKN